MIVLLLSCDVVCYRVSTFVCVCHCVALCGVRGVCGLGVGVPGDPFGWAPCLWVARVLVRGGSGAAEWPNGPRQT